jgi:hypothetical protein
MSWLRGEDTFKMMHCREIGFGDLANDLSYAIYQLYENRAHDRVHALLLMTVGSSLMTLRRGTNALA